MVRSNPSHSSDALKLAKSGKSAKIEKFVHPANSMRPSSKTKQAWADVIQKKWKNENVPSIAKQGAQLKRGIKLLEDARPALKNLKNGLAEQPFDQHLLNCSPLYRRSRDLYLAGGGKFIATLVSSSRSLSSAILLDPVIEYSPIEKELVWSATDSIESKHLDRLLKMRTYSSSLFHEQNHRILWKMLPPPPRLVKDRGALQRYLNFAESLVITVDMALADHLGPRLASLFYLTGVTYDPGTSVRTELKSARQYRNYLQAALHATYLNLELYDPSEIPRVISTLFPHLESYAERAARRSLNLDRAFVERTNLRWQRKNREIVLKKLARKSESPLELSDDPMNQVQQYLLAEKFFDWLEI